MTGGLLPLLVDRSRLVGEEGVALLVEPTTAIDRGVRLFFSSRYFLGQIAWGYTRWMVRGSVNRTAFVCGKKR